MNKVIGFILLGILAVSCVPQTPADVKVPLTNDIRKKVESAEKDIKALQFYISHDIRLQRERGGSQVEVQNGRIEETTGRHIESIVIKAFTPGICEEAGKDFVRVSFEEGKSLNFGVITGGSQTEVLYKVLANKWENGYGEVTYGENRYWITPTSANSHLLLRRNVVNKISTEQRVVGGRKVGG